MNDSCSSSINANNIYWLCIAKGHQVCLIISVEWMRWTIYCSHSPSQKIHVVTHLESLSNLLQLVNDTWRIWTYYFKSSALLATGGCPLIWFIAKMVAFLEDEGELKHIDCISVCSLQYPCAYWCTASITIRHEKEI